MINTDPNPVCEPTARNLLKLAVPIALGMASLSILGLLETSILGHYGQHALAASASANYLFFVFLSAFAGFSIAIQSQVARHIDDAPYIARKYTLVGLSQLVFVALSFILLVYFFNREMIAAQIHDEHIITQASEFLWIKSWSLLPIAILMALRGFLHGANQPKVFLTCLVSSHTLSGVLCYLLVYGKLGFPELGLKGAAFSTVISISLGTALLCLLTLRPLNATKQKGTINKITPSDYVTGWHLAWPTSFQQVIFAIGTAAFMAIIAKTSVTELAAAHLIITLSLVLILPVVGIGMSATTFISRSHTLFQQGETSPQNSQRWYTITLRLSLACILLVSPALLLTTESVLFALTKDPEVVAAAYWPLIILVFSLLFEAVTISTKQSLYALHQNKAVLTILSSTQWLILLPAMLIIHLSGNGSLEIYVLCHAIQRAINGILLYRIWKKEHQNPTPQPHISDVEV
ncbi:MATE family efflux transporter [Litoribrevibacter euphylliae]|uniref:MATE family efflux transporter n=1 Tax=Litoribrevibacter euphylliae TaxID=1834034 RepID=A0ABV7HB84_9GAMM